MLCYKGITSCYVCASVNIVKNEKVRGNSTLEIWWFKQEEVPLHYHLII